MSNNLIAALATGLMDLDGHKWGGTATDRQSLRPHYERDAERFLLPHLLAAAKERPACTWQLCYGAPSPCFAWCKCPCHTS